MTRRMRQLILGAIAVSLTAGIPDCGEAFRDQPAAGGAHGNYQIGSDDVLDIVVWNTQT